MKTLHFISIFIFICFVPFEGKAQNKLDICQNKVTHLVCTDKVSYLQVGDQENVIAEVVPDLSNLIRVKALKEFEGESSLTVVCSGRVYSLLLNYEDSRKITYQLEEFASEKAGSKSSTLMPDYVLKEVSERILSKRKKHSRGIKATKDGIEISLRNIYLKSGMLFFELQLSNKTNIAYAIEGVYFWIDDKKLIKATNAQEYQVYPKYGHYSVETIPANTTIREIFVLPKFTIPDKRILRIEMLETALGNTGRKVSLEINNKYILKAKLIK